MNYIAVDDEPFALEDIADALRAAAPEAELHSFTAPSKALEYAKASPVDVAFLDIELGSVSGLVLAKKLKDLRPEVHIIFVTSHEQYALNAIQLHATGYLMKPATAEDIRRELTFLYGDAPAPKRVRVQTFGGFEVFVDDQPVQFGRSKAKELLAYLIDHRGASVTAADTCAALWGDDCLEAGKKGYFRVAFKSLRDSLRDVGIEDILVRTWSSAAILPDRLDCDSYRFLDGDPQAVNSYRHDYLPGYNWAEFTME